MAEMGSLHCNNWTAIIVLVLNFLFAILALVLILLFSLIFLLKGRKGVVCVGLVCLDLVTVVDHFPKEDTDMRSSAQYKVKNGMSAIGLILI